MDLFVWPQRWNMASFDPDSLSVLAYVKFGTLPVNIRTDFNIFRAPADGAPFVVQGLNVASGVREIFEYFRKENYGIEYHLEGPDLVRLNALMRFVETELKPAIYHLYFLNETNFTQEVRKAYCEAVTFPASLLVASRLTKSVEQRIKKKHLCYDQLTEEQLQRQIYEQAKMCLTSLSYLLGTKNFFIGEKPTAIDAMLFGLLLPVLKAPLPQNALLSHLRQCDNLSRYCFRLQMRYFPEMPATANQNNDGDTSDSSGLAPALSFVGLRNTLLFSAAAASCSLLFALHYGLLEVGISDGNTEEEDRLTIKD